MIIRLSVGTEGNSFSVNSIPGNVVPKVHPPIIIKFNEYVSVRVHSGHFRQIS